MKKTFKNLILCMAVITLTVVAAFNVKAADYEDGWNLIGDRQYYYEDGELCSKTGVDVSAYQGIIDWEVAKNDGIEFAIIRIGIGDDIARQDDLYANRNMDECERLGIPYGVYIYSYAQDNDNVQSEIAHTLRMLQNRNPEIGVWFDSEENSSLEAAGASALNRFADTYLETIQNEYGYRAGLYASKYWLTSILTSDMLKQYDTWVAQYYNTLTYDGDFKIWQYASDGNVAGIPGRVDMDAMIVDSSDMIRMDYFADAAQTEIENYVRTDYIEYLGRPADESGLQAYSDKLQSTGDYAAIDNGLRSSDEYRSHVAETVVNALYNDVLNRNSDESGLEARTEYLMNTDIDAIVDMYISMDDSAEHRNAKKEEFIKKCYRFYLEREADEREVDAWMNTNLLRDINYGIYYSQEALNLRN